MRWNLTQAVLHAVNHHHRADRAHQAQQLVLQRMDHIVEVAAGANALRQVAQQFADAPAQRVALQRVHVDELERDHPADKFVELALAQADIARREVVAGNQAPEPVVLHQ